LDNKQEKMLVHAVDQRFWKKKAFKKEQHQGAIRKEEKNI